VPARQHYFGASKDRGMTVAIGYDLSGLIALGILAIGARFLLAPHPQPWDSVFPSAPISVRMPIFRSRVFATSRPVSLLGWFMLVATSIPVGDSLIYNRRAPWKGRGRPRAGRHRHRGAGVLGRVIARLIPGIGWVDARDRRGGNCRMRRRLRGQCGASSPRS
jgi:hypothetical protein